MKYSLWLIAVTVLLGLGASPKAQQVPQGSAIDIQRPTVIAFYPPASKGDEANADSNEALSDFQFYAERVKQPLSKLSIDFKELYVRSFRIHISGTDIVFRPKSDAVGYYLAAPGKKPRIEYGVMTDSDLLLVAKRYFGLPIKDE